MTPCIQWVVKKYYRHGSKSSFRANQPPTGPMIFESDGHEIRRCGTTSSKDERHVNLRRCLDTKAYLSKCNPGFVPTIRRSLTGQNRAFVLLSRHPQSCHSFSLVGSRFISRPLEANRGGDSRFARDHLLEGPRGKLDSDLKPRHQEIPDRNLSPFSRNIYRAAGNRG